MAKKNRRQSRKSATAKSTMAPKTAPNGQSGEQGFNPDYSYVIKDLKRIGILASSFFVVLIALTFFLR
jgi:hypothetical protein